MPFVPSIAGPVDGAAIYIAWLVVDVFLPLLMLLLSFKFFCCPPPLSIQHGPHPHLDGLIVILNSKGGSDDSKASSSAPLLPHSSSARGQARDGR